MELIPRDLASVLSRYVGEEAPLVLIRDTLSAYTITTPRRISTISSTNELEWVGIDSLRLELMNLVKNSEFPPGAICLVSGCGVACLAVPRSLQGVRGFSYGCGKADPIYVSSITRSGERFVIGVLRGSEGKVFVSMRLAYDKRSPKIEVARISSDEYLLNLSNTGKLMQAPILSSGRKLQLVFPLDKVYPSRVFLVRAPDLGGEPMLLRARQRPGAENKHFVLLLPIKDRNSVFTHLGIKIVLRGEGGTHLCIMDTPDALSCIPLDAKARPDLASGFIREVHAILPTILLNHPDEKVATFAKKLLEYTMSSFGLDPELSGFVRFVLMRLPGAFQGAFTRLVDRKLVEYVESMPEKARILFSTDYTVGGFAKVGDKTIVFATTIAEIEPGDRDLEFWRTTSNAIHLYTYLLANLFKDRRNRKLLLLEMVGKTLEKTVNE